MGAQSEQGLELVGVYTPVVLTTAGDTALVVALLNEFLVIIAEPDVAPAQAGGNDLEKMTASASAQIRVEIAAVIASISDA